MELARDAASETAQVYPREVEAVGRELQARGFALPAEVVRAMPTPSWPTLWRGRWRRGSGSRGGRDARIVV